jgi:acetyl/propionyl-CoA carboxylase alpha subunit
VWAETREAAINRLARALDEYVVEGIRTSLPFFRRVVRDEQFRRGDFDTGFIDRFLSRAKEEDQPDNQSDNALADIALLAAVLHTKARAPKSAASAPLSTESKWKLYGRTAQRR